MKTVKEVSELTGVSVRTLHHYDAIGLLKPSSVTEAGYRLYDEEALRRLQSILLFRELQFPLREIREILDRSDFDPEEALTRQIRLLELQRERLDRIIALARDIRQKGVNVMDFDAFDRSEIAAYESEAKEKWGGTDAWQEYAARPKRSAAEQQTAAEEMMDIFREIGGLKHLSPADDRVQALIARLQDHITGHYYTCSKEILRGLGQMYTGDPRMKKNIDKAGGEGTAAFAAEAIAVYTE